MAQEMNGKFLTTVGEHPPVIMCEKHAQVFEQTMMVNEIPHTIYELDDEDGPYYCHACDLQVAKAYAKRVEEAAQPKIIIPGEYNG
jgi:hypothetical protein